MTPNKIQGQTFTRELRFDAATADTSTRTIAASLSSTAPCERWFGIEILDHSKGAVDLSRASPSLTMLFNHDPSVPIGSAESVRIVGDKVRANLRFGNTPKADEIFSLVKDGHIRGVSVGYTVDEIQHTSTENGINTYTVKKWSLLECSIAPVAADPSVGVGRNFSSSKFGATHMTTENFDLAMQGRTRAANEIAQRAVETQRQLDLTILGREYEKEGGETIAARCLADGSDVETFKQRMLEKMKTVKSIPVDIPDMPREIAWGQGTREIFQKPEHFKGPDAEQRAYASGQWLRALHGNDQAGRWCKTNGMEVRAMSPAAISQGGALVPDQLSSTIIDLANSYGAFRQNADVYPMQSDTLGVPRSVSDPAATFTGVNGVITESQGDWNLVQLITKKIAAVVKIPTELLEDSVIGIADRVAFQLSRSFAKKEDECGFLGTGTSTYGGMSGINTLVVDGLHNAAKYTAAATHNLFSEIDTTDLAGVVASLPEYALDGAVWFCSGTAHGLVYSRLMQAAGGNTVATLGGAIPLSYAGFPIQISPVLPNGASTDYTGKPMLLFGNLRLSSKFGSRRDIRIQVLTERYADYDQVGIQATERFDIVNHDLGDNTTPGPMIALIGA